MLNKHWDYLILTAANDSQAGLYREQLAVRAKLGLLGEFRQWLVVVDPDGKRVGSGGSTICCLLEVLNQTCCTRRTGQVARVAGETADPDRTCGRRFAALASLWSLRQSVHPAAVRE